MVDKERLRRKVKPKETPPFDVSEGLEVTSPPPTEETPRIILTRTSPLPPTSEVDISSGAPCFSDEIRQRLVDELDQLIKRNWKMVEKGEESANKLVFYTKAQKLIADLQCPRKQVVKVPNA